MSKAEEAKLLGVSRGSLYYKPKLETKDEQLRKLIEAVMHEHPAYGYRRVSIELGVNKKRVLRVMQKFKLKPARRAKMPCKKADLGKESLSYPDIVKSLSPLAPNIIWVSDFTYLSFQGKFIYFSTVIDLFTREVVGFSVMTTHSSELVIRALELALKKTCASPEWFHSDQGSEYTSDKFLSLLASQKIKPSLSPKSSPWRNGSQESFFGRFKVEFGDCDRFSSLAELMEGIYYQINYYNNSRIHSSIKDKPTNFKTRWNKKNINKLSTSYESPPLEPPSAPRSSVVVRSSVDSEIYGYT